MYVVHDTQPESRRRAHLTIVSAGVKTDTERPSIPAWRADQRQLV